MPVSGGTTLKFENADCPHFKNLYLSKFLSYSSFAFKPNALSEPKLSTCTEWSITNSAGCKGFMSLGLLPSFLIASRMAAKSTTAGTPVKSCIKTLAGL